MARLEAIKKINALKFHYTVQVISHFKGFAAIFIKKGQPILILGKRFLTLTWRQTATGKGFLHNNYIFLYNIFLIKLFLDADFCLFSL